MKGYRIWLFFKTVTKQTKVVSLTLLTLAMLSLSCRPSQISKSGQLIMLLIVLLSAFSLLNSPWPSLKLRVFEYRLKLVSSKQLKILLAVKTTYYFLLGYILVLNLQLFTNGYLSVFKWLYLIIGIKTLVLKEIKLSEKIIIILYSALVIIGVPLIGLWFTFLGLLIFTDIVEPDYEIMERLTFYMDNALSIDSSSEMQLQIPKQRKGEITTQNAYVLFKVKQLLQKLFLLLIGIIGTIAMFNLLNIETERVITYGLFYVCGQLIFSYWISEDKRIKQAKLYPNQVIDYLIGIQAVVYVSSMLLIAVVLAVYFGAVRTIMLGLMTVAYIVVCELYLRIGVRSKLLIDVLFFLIVSSLFF